MITHDLQKLPVNFIDRDMSVSLEQIPDRPNVLGHIWEITPVLHLQDIHLTDESTTELRLMAGTSCAAWLLRGATACPSQTITRQQTMLVCHYRRAIPAMGASENSRAVNVAVKPRQYCGNDVCADDPGVGAGTN